MGTEETQITESQASWWRGQFDDGQVKQIHRPQIKAGLSLKN